MEQYIMNKQLEYGYMFEFSKPSNDENTCIAPETDPDDNNATE